MRRDSCSESQAQAKVSSQMPLEKKRSLSDFVIDNNGSLEDTKRQVSIFLHSRSMSTSILRSLVVRLLRCNIPSCWGARTRNWLACPRVHDKENYLKTDY